MADLELEVPGSGTVHVQARLEAYVARTLDELEMDAVEAHLLSCDACFAALLVVSLGAE